MRTRRTGTWSWARERALSAPVVRRRVVSTMRFFFLLLLIAMPFLRLCVLRLQIAMALLDWIAETACGVLVTI